MISADEASVTFTWKDYRIEGLDGYKTIPSDEMICWPVNTRVGNVKNNGPSLIEPLATAG